MTGDLISGAFRFIERSTSIFAFGVESYGIATLPKPGTYTL
jgi:hypothetical protein